MEFKANVTDSHSNNCKNVLHVTLSTVKVQGQNMSFQIKKEV